MSRRLCHTGAATVAEIDAVEAAIATRSVELVEAAASARAARGSGEHVRSGTSTRRSNGSLQSAPTAVAVKQESPADWQAEAAAAAQEDDDVFAALAALADEAMQVPSTSGAPCPLPVLSLKPSEAACGAMQGVACFPTAGPTEERVAPEATVSTCMVRLRR